MTGNLRLRFLRLVMSSLPLVLCGGREPVIMFLTALNADLIAEPMMLKATSYLVSSLEGVICELRCALFPVQIAFSRAKIRHLGV